MYDFYSIIDRDPAVRGTSKYAIMKDSKGNPPPRGTVPLSVADMEFRTAPEIIEAIKAEADFGVFGYHKPTGDFARALCGWMKRRHRWEVEPEWIVPFEQVVPALYNAIFAFTQPGDKIVVQTPAYFHFFRAALNTGRIPVDNTLIDDGGDYKIDFDDLREKCKGAKLLMLCSPHNPSGRVWTEEELRRVGDICAENGVIVLADEIHHDLIQKPHRHVVFASLGEKYANNCIVTTALSKTFNLAGLCFASIIIPNGELRAKFAEQMPKQGFMNVNRFGPVAAEAAYNKGDAWLDELNAYIGENYRYLKSFMAEKFPGVFVCDLQGTYLAWINFEKLGMTPEERRVFLTDECGLYLNNGMAFGEAGRDYERLNLACPRKILAEALDRLYEAARKKGIVQ